MTSPHLSERDLQQAAEPFSQLPAIQAAHLRGCSLCQGRVATYQQLFADAAQLPQPAFAFGLTATVLARLPRAQPALPWVLGVVAALVLGVVVAFLLLFGGALVQAFQDVFTLLGAGLAAVAGVVVARQCCGAAGLAPPATAPAGFFVIFCNTNGSGRSHPLPSRLAL